MYYDHPYGHKGRIPRTIGVRERRFSYTRYVSASPVYEQLFDLDADPNQLTNLIDDPQFASNRERLRRRCDAYRDDVVAASEE